MRFAGAKTSQTNAIPIFYVSLLFLVEVSFFNFTIAYRRVVIFHENLKRKHCKMEKHKCSNLSD